MKRREYQPIVHAITSAIPSFTSKRRLLMLSPVARILRGLYLEDSSAPDEFYVWAFVQPLYVPATTITFSLGKRLGGVSRSWRASETTSLINAVRSDGLPFVADADSPQKLADYLERSGSDDANTLEAKAYSFAAAGKFASARAPFDALIAVLDDQIPWQSEKKEHVQQLKTLCSSAPEKASQVLRENERTTRIALGLSDAV